MSVIIHCAKVKDSSDLFDIRRLIGHHYPGLVSVNCMYTENGFLLKTLEAHFKNTNVLQDIEKQQLIKIGDTKYRATVTNKNTKVFRCYKCKTLGHKVKECPVWRSGYRPTKALAIQNTQPAKSAKKLRRQAKRHAIESLSTLESLPNEILLEILRLLPARDTIFAFYNMNARIRHLIGAFQSINFTALPYTFFLEYCAMLMNREHELQSLTLSNLDSCEQIELFFSNFPVEQLKNLRSLTLFNPSYPVLDTILSKLSVLGCLSSLKIEFKEDAVSSAHFFCNFDTSVSLRLLKFNGSVYMSGFCVALYPNLVFLKITSTISLQYYADLLQSIPKTLEKLSVKLDVSDDLTDDIANLFLQNSNNVKHLKISIADNITFNHFQIMSIPFHQLLTLSFEYDADYDDTDDSYFDGSDWEQFIKSYLPCLKTLDIVMNVYDFRRDIYDRLQTFQTSFWFERK
ncbi:unnamed protein product, partial [Didymodactylos carnosus]